MSKPLERIHPSMYSLIYPHAFSILNFVNITFECTLQSVARYEPAWVQMSRP